MIWVLSVVSIVTNVLLWILLPILLLSVCYGRKSYRLLLDSSTPPRIEWFPKYRLHKVLFGRQQILDMMENFSFHVEEEDTHCMDDSGSSMIFVQGVYCHDKRMVQIRLMTDEDPHPSNNSHNLREIHLEYRPVCLFDTGDLFKLAKDISEYQP